MCRRYAKTRRTGEAAVSGSFGAYRNQTDGEEEKGSYHHRQGKRKRHYVSHTRPGLKIKLEAEN